MCNHFIKKCKECNIVISQCRCMASYKVVIWDICQKCTKHSLFYETELGVPWTSTINIDEAIQSACAKPTLLEALVWICGWENERAIKQAKKGLIDADGKGWDTCFRVCIAEILEKYEPTVEMLKIIAVNEWPKDSEVGKEAQCRGIDIPPNAEMEIAYGQYKRLVKLITKEK